MLLRKINVFKLQFCKFEKFVSMSVFGELQLIQISLQLENQRSGNKIVCGFSILILNGIMMFYSQRVHAFCWTKIKTLIKMERNQKWKIQKWKKKRGHFLYCLFCPKDFFFNICVLSQFIVYWVHFQNIHTFTYQKILLHTLFLLVFEIVESLQCILLSKLWLIFSCHDK